MNGIELIVLSDNTRTKQNIIQFENKLTIWFKNAAKWWDDEIKKVEEWNRKVLDTIKDEEFLIKVPKRFIPNPNFLTDIYHSKLSKQTRKQYLTSIVSQLEELAEIVSSQLLSYQTICNKFLLQKNRNNAKRNLRF